MNLRQIRSRATQDLDLLLEEAIALTELLGERLEHDDILPGQPSRLAVLTGHVD